MKKGNTRNNNQYKLKECTFSSKESPRNPHYYADNDIFLRVHIEQVFSKYICWLLDHYLTSQKALKCLTYRRTYLVAILFSILPTKCITSASYCKDNPGCIPFLLIRTQVPSLFWY